MTTKTPLITGTDFITVATKDYDTAAEFYGEVLGLPFSKRWGNMPAGGRLLLDIPPDQRTEEDR